MFSQLKHVGMCMSRPSEEELCLLIQFAYDLLEKRKKLFAQYNRTSFASMRRVQRLPLTFLSLTDLTISRQGTGPSGARSASSAAEGRTGFRHSVHASRRGRAQCDRQTAERHSDVFALTADRYVSVSGSAGYPAEGLSRSASRTRLHPKGQAGFRVPCSRARPQLDDAERYGQILSQIETANTIWKDAAEPDHLTQIDPEQTYEEFIAPFKPERIPLGIIRSRLRPIALPFQQLSTLPVYFGNPDAVNYVMGAIQTAVKRAGAL